MVGWKTPTPRADGRRQTADGRCVRRHLAKNGAARLGRDCSSLGFVQGPPLVPGGCAELPLGMVFMIAEFGISLELLLAKLQLQLGTVN